MQIFSRLSPFLVVLLLAGCAAAFSPQGSGFSVQMPGTVKEQPDKNGHIFASQSDGRAYVASYADIRGVKASSDQMLDNARNGMVANAHVKVISEKKITVDGHPGRDLQMVAKNGYSMRFRIAIANSKLYQVGVVSEKADASPEVEAFLDTFHIAQ